MTIPEPPGSKRVHYSLDGKTVMGPTTIDEIILGFMAGTIPSTASILPVGQEQWMLFTQIPDAWISPLVLQQLLLHNTKKTEGATAKKVGAEGAQMFVALLFIVGITSLLLATCSRGGN